MRICGDIIGSSASRHADTLWPVSTSSSLRVALCSAIFTVVTSRLPHNTTISLLTHVNKIDFYNITIRKRHLRSTFSISFPFSVTRSRLQTLHIHLQALHLLRIAVRPNPQHLLTIPPCLSGYRFSEVKLDTAGVCCLTTSELDVKLGDK
jgi:hypothetical protein